MKRLAFLVLALTLLVSSCGIPYLLTTTPERLTKIDGKIECVVDCNEYELMVGKEVTKKQSSTQSRMWLYTHEEEYYWYIERSAYETQNSFFEQTINVSVISVQKSEVGDKTLYSYFGIDEATGESFYVKELAWSKGYGRFYLVGNAEKRIVYSVPISNINWR